MRCGQPASGRRSLSAAVALAALALALLPGPASAAGLGLTAYLLRSGEQPGFSVLGRPVVSRSLAPFLLGDSPRQRAARGRMLRAAGFRAFAAEQLTGARGQQGFSLVFELTSPAGARSVAAAFDRWASIGQSGRLTAFTVPGVGRSAGVRAVARGISTANAYWVEGRCALAAGDALTRSDAGVAAPVIAGARALYRRTRGVCR